MLAATSDTMAEADTCHLVAVREVLRNLKTVVDISLEKKRAEEGMAGVRKKLDESVKREQKAVRKLGRVMEVLTDGSDVELTEEIKKDGEEVKHLRKTLLSIMREDEEYMA